MPSAWSGVAVNKKFTAEDGPLIARMNANLCGPIPAGTRRSLHFALGKAHDDLGNDEMAIRNFQAGNRFASASDSSAEALAWRVDQIIAATPPATAIASPSRRRRRNARPDRRVAAFGDNADGTDPVRAIPTSRRGANPVRVHTRPEPQGKSGNTAPEATRRLAEDYLAAPRSFGPEAKRVTDKA